MKFALLLIHTAVFGYLAVAAEEGHCTWYNICYTTPEGDGHNCAYNGTAKPLVDPHALSLLQSLCPQFINNSQYGNETLTCCGPQQLEVFTKNIQAGLNFLSRCPSCMKNFQNLYCYFTCAPHHSRYLKATSFDYRPGKPKSINAVKYYVTDSFAQGLFNSCSNVQLPSNNQRALGAVCGVPADKCNASYWLKFMGDKNINPLTPFQLDFKITKTKVPGIEPMNATIIPCDMAISNDSDPCSCQDCKASCSKPIPPPAPKQPWKILHIDAYTFIAAAAWIAFILLFGTGVICKAVVCNDSVGVSRPCCESDPDSTELIPPDASVNNELTRPVLPDEVGCFQRVGLRFELFLESVFTRWAVICVKHPFIVIFLSLAVCGALTAGISQVKITTDPVELWSSPDSRARREREYFNKHFTPFYRTEMVIIRAKNSSYIRHKNTGSQEGYSFIGPVFNQSLLFDILELQNHITHNITATYNNETVTLQDICFSPLAPDNNHCTIMSILNYFQNDKAILNYTRWSEYHLEEEGDYVSHLMACTQDPLTINDSAIHKSCLGEFGGPILPWVALGGYEGNNYMNATAMFITYSVNNYLDNEEFIGKAMAWEKKFIEYMKQYSHPDLHISFAAERSIEDEIDRESNSDVMTITISYLLMFAYVSFALGQYRSCDPKKLLVDAKMSLGLSGVVIVLLSVSSSLGFFSYLGVPLTLIIIEVVPFLVLAVGVDNIFILVQKYQRTTALPGESVEFLIGRVVGQVGPSMLLTATSESVAFFFGALTTMPAVREFSLYAGMAVFIDFLLQISCFVSLLSLDARRQRAHRLDCCCCAQSTEATDDMILLEPRETTHNGWLFQVAEILSKPLLSCSARPIIMVIFTALFAASIPAASKLEIGLDQKLSMPKDSYVLEWFKDENRYLSVGAPVYFVVKEGYNYTDPAAQNRICGGSGCSEDSLLGRIYQASNQPNYTYIAHPASSWIDDYFDWLRPIGNPPCCRQYTNGSFCPAQVNGTCHACNVTFVKRRPSPKDFPEFLSFFLEDNPGRKCSKGGHAAYQVAVERRGRRSVESIGATYFMSYHTVLKTSADFINALRYARELSDNITKSINDRQKHDRSLMYDEATNSGRHEQNTSVINTGIKVFPYSVFYVFYEQYLTIVADAAVQLSICLAAMFVVTFLLLGLDIHSSLIILVCVVMIMSDMLGVMYIWDINLNAVSLVNLVMCIGISVEFCSHMVRAFAVSTCGSKIERARHAFVHTGSSVFSGITLTKSGGIIVLAFSKSQLFQVFYFRMYLSIVLLGAFHGLIFLPILLSYAGPGINKAKLERQQKLTESSRTHEDNSPKF